MSLKDMTTANKYFGYYGSRAYFSFTVFMMPKYQYAVQISR